MSKTSEVIKGMLTENTGTHFLDSGGAYGRSWQRNQGRDFENDLETVLSFKYGGISITHNLYHWLNDRVEYSEQMQELFDKFTELPENEDDHWLALMEKFPQWLMDNGYATEIGGIYGDGDPFVHNTYNGEDLLEQVLQFLYMTIEGLPEDEESDIDLRGEYVLLQIHGGCDVRGGYTAPKAFEMLGHSELAMFDNARASIYCLGEHCDNNYYTDDGYHWYHEGACGRGYHQLESWERLNVEDVTEEIGLKLGTDELIMWLKMCDRQAEIYCNTLSHETNAFSFNRWYITTMMVNEEESAKNRFLARMILKFMLGKRVFVVDEDEDKGYCPYCYSELHGSPY